MRKRSFTLLLCAVSCILPAVVLAEVISVGEWNEWSTCTKACGMGTRRRVKKCPNGIEDCQIQIKMCNLHKCDDGSSKKEEKKQKEERRTVIKTAAAETKEAITEKENEGTEEVKIMAGPAGATDTSLHTQSVRDMMNKKIIQKVKTTASPKPTKNTTKRTTKRKPTKRKTTTERKITTTAGTTQKEEITVSVNDAGHDNVFDNDGVKVRFVETTVSDKEKIQNIEANRNVDTVWEENMASYKQKMYRGRSGIKMVTSRPRTKKKTTESKEDPNRHVFYSDSSKDVFEKKKKEVVECKDHNKCRDYYYQRHTWCRYHPWIILNCKVMCQNCPVPELAKKQEPVACTDHPQCPNYVFQGHVWCRMHAWIKTNCRAMCGTCPASPCQREDHMTCMDQAENKFYYCQTSWTQTNCPRMCGKCVTPECKVPDHPSCTMYENRPEYYCKHQWLRQNCKNTCGHCYKRGPNWPAGEYGILSRDKCPPFWYEFNHCMDTENKNNKDRFDQFSMHSDYKCDRSSLTFRYCFRGPNVPTQNTGFWTRGGLRSSLYTIKNNRGDCEKFGRDGGTVQVDDERDYNRNEYGTDYSEEFHLNGHRFSDYSPADFIYGPYARTRLSFCEIGYNSPDKSSNVVLNVGKFNWQKFGFFINPDGVCPTINSPYGYLTGKKADFFMDNENSHNRNRVVSGQPPVYVGADSSWSVCEYDPYSNRDT